MYSQVRGVLSFLVGLPRLLAFLAFMFLLPRLVVWLPRRRRREVYAALERVFKKSAIPIESRIESLGRWPAMKDVIIATYQRSQPRLKVGMVIPQHLKLLQLDPVSGEHGKWRHLVDLSKSTRPLVLNFGSST